jgi:hypothetical protein
MTELLDYYRKWLALAALAIGWTGFCLLCGLWLSRLATNPDDGWRRTELGWEHVAAWNEPAMATATVPVFHRPTPEPAKTSPRWDTHPAALALVQLGVAFFALFAMPADWRLTDLRPLTRLPVLIAKSFRASPFG